MTTLAERIAALKSGVQFLARLAQAPDGTEAARLGRWYARDYPNAVDFDRRLVAHQGYRLLLAVQRIERVRALIDAIDLPLPSRFADFEPAWIDEARRIARHFPRRDELLEAVRSPHHARVWADFYLDRPTNQALWRSGDGRPERMGRAAQRRQALRRMPFVIRRLEADVSFPPLGVAGARRVLLVLPTRSEMGQRLSGLSSQRFHEVLDAWEQGCQLIEAVVEGTLPASARPRALARGIGPHLPSSECFPLYGLDSDARKSWLRRLLLSGSATKR